ncbi:MAG: type II 3-dehydroquinate dehydratase [Myxococcales bacterium]|nr:type II 3-dehydroquinate dehydratase [Myxococcales bacterium]
MRILLLNGPNLNELGRREPEVYGRTTLAEIEARLQSLAAEAGARLETFQSNHEGALIDRLQAARGEVEGLILNPGGLTHTSVALRDAVALLVPETPCIEVHLSNIYAREPFRQTSLLAGVVTGQISGLGPLGYELAFRALTGTGK